MPACDANANPNTYCKEVSAWTRIVINVFSPGERMIRRIRHICAVQIASGRVYWLRKKIRNNGSRGKWKQITGRV